MKLILENWNKFLKEQELKEATEEEIGYLDDALEIPIEEMPFSNIFGDSYRIIEPVTSLKKKTPLADTIETLNKFGWEVDPASNLEYFDTTKKGRLAGKVKSGKILCSKAKVSHYIDGKGNQGISRKTITLNLPKVLGGIINFVKNTRSKLATAAGKQIETSLKRYFDSIELEDAKYDAPIGVEAKMTANEYRTSYKFFDTQNYWVGDVGDQKMAADLSKFFKSKNINFESFENFAEESGIDKFDDLVRNMDQYLERNYIIYSRHPIDVFRMSDHQGIQSCHSLPSSKNDQSFDQYNKCALSEVYGNGMIAYIVPVKEFKMFPPTQESLDNFGDQEIFFDYKRKDATAGLIEPTSRIRIKNVAFHKDENSEPIRLAVPQGNIYGPQVPGFLKALNKKITNSQEKEIKEIIKQGAEDLGKPTIFLSKFTRYGGSYQDLGYSVAEMLPMLFRKYNREVVLQGSSVRYEPDVEEALLASIGQNASEVLRQRLNEIFDEHTGGFISFDWDVEEGHNGALGFSWYMHVKFRINAPSDAQIKSSVEDTIDYDLPGYYEFPVSDNIFIERNDEGTWMVKIVYDGRQLSRATRNIDGLEEALPEIVKKFDAFDYYYDDGPIQMIEFALERDGIIKSERFVLRDVLKTYDLPDDSWWPEEDRESEEIDFFGGEAISFIAFQDESGVDISAIKEKIPENMKQNAYELMAKFFNTIFKSDELSGKLALNQDTWNKETDPAIVIMHTEREDVTPELIEQADEIEFRAGVSMYSDYSKEILEKTGDFLQNNASIDDIAERMQMELEKYLAKILKPQQNITENKRRIRIHVRR